MVRTRADGCAAVRKAVAARAPRKSLGSCSNSEPTSPGVSSKYSGGNPVCPRPTPDWQRNITNFFKTSDTSGSNNNSEETEGQSTSHSSSTD